MDKSKKLDAALKELEDLRGRYNDRVAFGNEMIVKVQEQDSQTKKLI